MHDLMLASQHLFLAYLKHELEDSYSRAINYCARHAFIVGILSLLMDPRIPKYMQKIQVSNAAIKCSQKDWDQIFKRKKTNSLRRPINTNANIHRKTTKDFSPNGF